MSTSGSTTGRLTTARSRRAGGELGDQRGGRGVDGHQARPWGGSRPARARSAGTSHRPVVPMTPRRTWPEISPSEEATSAAEGFQLGLDAAGPGHHEFAGLGEQAGGSIDQRGAELLFEVGDVGGDVRLHGVEGTGGRREALVVGDGGEGGELAEVHRCRNDATLSGTTVGQIAIRRDAGVTDKTAEATGPPPGLERRVERFPCRSDREKDRPFEAGPPGLVPWPWLNVRSIVAGLTGRPSRSRRTRWGRDDRRCPARRGPSPPGRPMRGPGHVIDETERDHPGHLRVGQVDVDALHPVPAPSRRRGSRSSPP